MITYELTFSCIPCVGATMYIYSSTVLYTFEVLVLEYLHSMLYIYSTLQLHCKTMHFFTPLHLFDI